MSFENGDSNPRSNADNRFCGVHQGFVNHQFHPDGPQTPPPRYEDVISGEYLKRTEISYIHPPSRTDEPANVTCHCTNSYTDLTQSDPGPGEQGEGCKLSPVWILLVATLMVILVWLAALKMGFS